MKRLFVVFPLVLAALLPAAASGQLSAFQLSQELLDFMAAAPPADDLAVGEGKFARTEKGETTQFTLSAHGPDPSPFPAARGTFRIKVNGVERRGTVECMAVNGNEARVEGTFDEPITAGAATFPDFFIILTDNGEPNGPGGPDEAEIFLDETQVPCVVVPTALAGGALVQGNIVVMDRP
jgi:hypothetical protein